MKRTDFAVILFSPIAWAGAALGAQYFTMWLVH